jgi:hypothetical protein
MIILAQELRQLLLVRCGDGIISASVDSCHVCYLSRTFYWLEVGILTTLCLWIPGYQFGHKMKANLSKKRL